jgi:hypothetical protein
MKNKLTVEVVYIVPSDSKPWGDAKLRATEWLEDMQWYFADEMKKHGYDAKTFEIARDNSGEIIFHQIGSTLTKADFENRPWEKCKKIAKSHGVVDANNIIVYFIEAYRFPVGEKPIAVARGASKEVFLSILYLKLAKREWIANENGYKNKVFDWIECEPMDGSILSWHGRGKKIGDVSGSAVGTMAHELGHALDLYHDKENDKNRKGNLMGNGFRGMRGYFRPDITDDFCVLTKRDAKFLNNSRYFSIRKLKRKSVAFY